MKLLGTGSQPLRTGPLTVIAESMADTFGADNFWADTTWADSNLADKIRPDTPWADTLKSRTEHY